MVVTKAIFFDLDDTLHDFKRASSHAMNIVYDEIAGRHNIDKDKLKHRYAELLKDAEEHAFLDGRLSGDYRTERFENLLQTFGVNDLDFVRNLVALYGNELEKEMRPFDEVHEILDKLSKEYDLFLVTEGPLDAQQKAVKILGLESYFKKIFISGGAKKIKSTGDLFEHAVRESGYGTDEILIVGDSYKRDVLGGIRAGLKVIWLNKKNETINDIEPKPFGEIKKLGELEDVIKKKICGATDRNSSHTMVDLNDEYSGPIMLLGHPRSGTNFISSILRSHPKVNILIEPFSQHLGFISEYDMTYWKKTDFDPFLFNKSLMDKPMAVEFFREFKNWLYFSNGERRMFKETTFFLQLEWLREYLPDLRILYIERDPLEVFASFKQSDFFNKWNYSRRFQILNEQVSTHDELREYRDILAATDRNSWIDQLATIWYVKTREARKQLENFNNEIFTYEEIVLNPVPEFDRMFKFAGLDLAESTVQNLHERTKENKGMEYSTFRSPKRTFDEWKSILDTNEKAIVKKRLGPFIRDKNNGRYRKAIT